MNLPQVHQPQPGCASCHCDKWDQSLAPLLHQGKTCWKSVNSGKLDEPLGPSITTLPCFSLENTQTNINQTHTHTGKQHTLEHTLQALVRDNVGCTISSWQLCLATSGNKDDDNFQACSTCYTLYGWQRWQSVHRHVESLVALRSKSGGLALVTASLAEGLIFSLFEKSHESQTINTCSRPIR